MKVVVTGSLGNISKPLTTELVQKGHTVTVISSNEERSKEIKALGAIAANYGADTPYVWVSPIDIAAAIVEELETPLMGKKVRYVASDELTGKETATIVGAAIGQPDLQWMIIPNEQMQSGLEVAGMNPQIAAGLVETYAGVGSGILFEDYYRNQSTALGKVKMTDFAKEFAAAF